VAQGLRDAIIALCHDLVIDTVVLSGGVFQNELLLSDIRDLMRGSGIAIWTNRSVPPNDGGISLGQAALAAFVQEGPAASTTTAASTAVTPSRDRAK
jgi:hydrogenase maturation protein HypF